MGLPPWLVPAYFEGLAEWAVTGRGPSAEDGAELILRHDA